MSDHLKPPSGRDSTEVRYDFTPVQLQTLTPVLEELQHIQDKVSFFLKHVAREAGLPRAEGEGYSLRVDPETGTPYLIGQVRNKEAKK